MSLAKLPSEILDLIIHQLYRPKYIRAIELSCRMMKESSRRRFKIVSHQAMTIDAIRRYNSLRYLDGPMLITQLAEIIDLKLDVYHFESNQQIFLDFIAKNPDKHVKLTGHRKSGWASLFDYHNACLTIEDNPGQQWIDISTSLRQLIPELKITVHIQSKIVRECVEFVPPNVDDIIVTMSPYDVWMPEIGCMQDIETTKHNKRWTFKPNRYDSDYLHAKLAEQLALPITWMK